MQLGSLDPIQVNSPTGVGYSLAPRGALLLSRTKEFHRLASKNPLPLALHGLLLHAIENSRPIYFSDSKQPANNGPQAKDRDPFWLAFLGGDQPADAKSSQPFLDPGGARLPMSNTSAVGFDAGTYWFTGNEGDGPVFSASIKYPETITMQQAVAEGITHLVQQEVSTRLPDTWISFVTGKINVFFNGKIHSCNNPVAIYTRIKWHISLYGFLNMPDAAIEAGSPTLMLVSGAIRTPPLSSYSLSSERNI